MAGNACFIKGLEKMQKSIKRNFLMNIILTSSSFIFPLLSFPYIQRILGPEGTGKVSFASSIISYFSLIARLGIPTYGVRACAKLRNDVKKLSQLVQELFCINLIMTFITYILLFLVLKIVPKFQEDKSLYLIISLEIIFYTIGLEWLFRGLEQYTYISISSIACKFFAVIAMFILVRNADDYIIYGGLTIFAASASYLLNFFYSRRFVTLRPTGELHLRQHIKPIMVFAAMTCATMIYLHLDVAMLGFMRSNTDVGYYNMAVKIKVLLVSVVTSLGHVILPRSAYYIDQGKNEEFHLLVQKALNFVLVVAAPLVVYFIIFAQETIMVLSGSAYLNSVLPMKIIMPTVLLIGLSNISGIQILIPLGKEKLVLYSEIIGALVDLVLNYLLIPRFAATGAAFGTLIAEFVVLFIQFIILRNIIVKIFKTIHFRPIIIALLGGIIVSLSVYYTIRFLPSANSSMLSWNIVLLFSSVVSFFSVYGVILLLLKEPFVLSVYDSFYHRIKH